MKTNRRYKDQHKLAASKMFNVPYSMVTDHQREQAKMATFGARYGSTPTQLQNKLK